MQTLAQKLLSSWFGPKKVYTPKCKKDKWGSSNKYDRRECRAKGNR